MLTPGFRLGFLVAPRDVYPKLVSAKQAAGIMQYMPPARAAAISKLVLRGGHE